MSTGKRKKKSWFKIQVAKVRILPWYWKLVVTIVLFLQEVPSGHSFSPLRTI